jgi:hypothetical protein
MGNGVDNPGRTGRTAETGREVADSGRGLVDDLRELAASSDLPRSRLQSIMRTLMAAIIERGELLAGPPGKARRRLAVACRMVDARQAGASIDDLCARFDVGRTTVYERMRAVRKNPDTSVLL